MASSRPDGVRDEGSSRTFVVPQAIQRNQTGDLELACRRIAYCALCPRQGQ